jgi:hypothetical protein
MIVEDAHWSDPTSLELFGRVVDRIRSLRAVLVVTFRSEFEPPWIGRAHVTALTINRLTEREIGVREIPALPWAGPSRHANSPHPSSREEHHSTAWWNSGFLLFHLIS